MLLLLSVLIVAGSPWLAPVGKGLMYPTSFLCYLRTHRFQDLVQVLLLLSVLIVAGCPWLAPVGKGLMYPTSFLCYLRTHRFQDLVQVLLLLSVLIVAGCPWLAPVGKGLMYPHKLPVLSAGDVERLSGIPCLSPTITLVRKFVRNKVVSLLCMQHSICRIAPFVYIQQQYRDCMGSSVFASTESLRDDWMITEEPLFTLLLVSG